MGAQVPEQVKPLEINYSILVELQTGGDDTTPTWSDMGKCMENIGHVFEEQSGEYFFFSDEGFGRSEVTGGQLVVTAEGKVMPGDAVSDYLTNSDKVFGFGAARHSRIRVTKGNEQIIWNVTLKNLGGQMGAAIDPNGLSIEIRSNGKPSIGTV